MNLIFISLLMKRFRLTWFYWYAYAQKFYVASCNWLNYLKNMHWYSKCSSIDYDKWIFLTSQKKYTKLHEKLKFEKD